MLIYIIFLLALNKNTFKIHSNYILIKYGRFFHLKLCKLLLGEKTVIFINSCIKFAALRGIAVRRRLSRRISLFRFFVRAKK